MFGLSRSARQELGAAGTYILLFGALVWVPLVFCVWDDGLAELLFDLRGLASAAMYVSGAVIANATAVGGGLIFNPTLQLVFEVGGYSALVLSILVQSAGMPSGSYGWYRKGEYGNVRVRDLLLLVVGAAASVFVLMFGFLALVERWPDPLLKGMRLASAGVSFYVFAIVWQSIQTRERLIQRLAEDVSAASAEEIVAEVRELVEHDESGDAEPPARLAIDRRLAPWVIIGAALNITTSVGMGELVFSHLIRYYDAPPKTAVAVGTLLQTIAVWVQAVFLLFLFRDLIVLDLVLIGVLFCMVGGRLAPFVLSRPVIEPHMKHILAFTALAMGIVSVLMLAQG